MPKEKVQKHREEARKLLRDAMATKRQRCSQSNLSWCARQLIRSCVLRAVGTLQGFGVAFNQLVFPLKSWDSVFQLLHALGRYPPSIPAPKRFKYITNYVNSNLGDKCEQYPLEDLEFVGTRLEARYSLGSMCTCGRHASCGCLET